MKISKDYLASIIDHTLLNPDATTNDVERLCEEAVLHGFGAVCIRPNDVSRVSQLLHNTGVKVCTVIGFPWGIQTRKAKIEEAYEAIHNGAAEIDVVLNRSYIKDKYHVILKRELSEIIANAKLSIPSQDDVLVKIILETCKLTDDEIVKACLISEEAGADYVKTSTGLYGGATLKDVKLMHKTVPNLGVKASGGIKDWNKAYKMINAGATRIGTSSGVKILEGYLKSLQV